MNRIKVLVFETFDKCVLVITHLMLNLFEFNEFLKMSSGLGERYHEIFYVEMWIRDWLSILLSIWFELLTFRLWKKGIKGKVSDVCGIERVSESL